MVCRGRAVERRQGEDIYCRHAHSLCGLLIVISLLSFTECGACATKFGLWKLYSSQHGLLILKMYRFWKLALILSGKCFEPFYCFFKAWIPPYYSPIVLPHRWRIIDLYTFFLNFDPSSIEYPLVICHKFLHKVGEGHVVLDVCLAKLLTPCSWIVGG